MGDQVDGADNLEELIRQANVQARTGNRRAARRILIHALTLHPQSIDEARIFYLLGQLTEERGEAIQCLEHALKLAPGNRMIRAKLDELRITPEMKAKERRTNQLVGCGSLVFIAVLLCTTVIALRYDPKYADPTPTTTPTPYWLAPTQAPRLVATFTSGPPPTVTPLPCDCQGPDLDCKDFPGPASANARFRYCRSLGLEDIFRLDGDLDGVVCENQ